MMSQPTEPSRQYHLLVVEDDTSTLHLITSTLQGVYRVSIAKTLERARILLSQQNFDLVLLDVNLPDGSGFDLCRDIIAGNDLFHAAQVIFMTGMTSSDDELTGLTLGATDYIHKPLNPEILKARLRNQTQLIRRSELLAKLANIDSLTEIPNRRAFEERFTQEWNRAKRHEVPLTVIMVDIDQFKQYNDCYGHPAGDVCLQEVATLLMRHFKRGSDLVSRYGGEEFVILLPETDNATALQLCNNACQAVRDKAIEHKGSTSTPYVTLSAGVCTTIPKDGNGKELMQMADDQLYQAKARGRNQIACHTY